METIIKSIGRKFKQGSSLNLICTKKYIHYEDKPEHLYNQAG